MFPHKCNLCLIFQQVEQETVERTKPYESIEQYQMTLGRVLAIEAVINACKGRDTLFLNNMQVTFFKSSMGKLSCEFSIKNKFAQARRIRSFVRLNKFSPSSLPVYPQDLFCIRVKLKNRWVTALPGLEIFPKVLSARNIWCAHATLASVSLGPYNTTQVKLEIHSSNFPIPPAILKGGDVETTIEILEKLLPDKWGIFLYFN